MKGKNVANRRFSPTRPRHRPRIGSSEGGKFDGRIAEFGRVFGAGSRVLEGMHSRKRRKLPPLVAQNAELIERSRRRVANLQKELDAQRAELERVVERQEQLRREIEAVPDVCRHGRQWHHRSDCIEGKVGQSAERDALRATPPRLQKDDHKSFPVMPMMPNLVPAELEDWMKGRQQTFRSFGTYCRMWLYVGDGKKDGPMTQDRNRDARYGLRGMRVGEASNPGPTVTPDRQRRRTNCANQTPERSEERSGGTSGCPSRGVGKVSRRCVATTIKALDVVSEADQPQVSQSVVDVLEFD